MHFDSNLRTHQPFLIWTNEHCEIDGQPLPELPLLFDGQMKPVVVASDWFRYLSVGGKVATSSIKRYAKVLRNFWQFIEEQGTDWADVNDQLLATWRNRDLFERKLQKKTCNDKLLLVYRFYMWAQSGGYVSDIIGPGDWKRASSTPIVIEFSSGENIAHASGRRLRKSERLTSNLIFRAPRKEVKHVPTADEMDDVYLQLSSVSDESLAIRNTLILNWAELVGLRRAEILSLKCIDIPVRSEIFRLQNEGSVFPLRVVGKGGHARIVPVTPELLRMTQEYILGDRSDVLERTKKNDPTFIFISHRSGQKLSLDYVTNILSSAFKKADVKATLHRARARFLSRVVQQSLDEAVEKYGFGFSYETVLLKASEIAGHSDISSLKYYLNLHIKYKARSQTEVGRVHELSDEELMVRRELATSTLRLKLIDSARKMTEILDSGDSESIQVALDELNNQFSLFSRKS